MTAAIAPGCLSATSAIARPRSWTSAIASRSGSDAAAASAEYSPTEWPTTKSGLMPRVSTARRHASEVATSAGCCTSVRVSFSIGPSKHTWATSYPTASEASS